MNIQVVLLVAATTALLSVSMLPGWRIARKSGVLYPWDLLVPAAPIALWFYLAGTGHGHQSLANLLELPLCATIAVVPAYARILLVKGRHLSRIASLVILPATLYVPIFLRSHMPLIPE